MRTRTIFGRAALVAFGVLLSLFPFRSTQAASVTLAWNPSPSTNVSGYEVFYGLASGQYTESTNVGANTSVTIAGLTPGTTYYMAALAYDSAGDESPFSNEILDNTPASPVITTQPGSQSVAVGANTTFSVVASGSGPLLYQWYDNSAMLAGATNATLVLPAVSEASAGIYYVSVQNAAGGVLSANAVLTVTNSVTPPVLLHRGRLLSQSVAVGANTSLHLNVEGTAPFTYQWFYNGIAIPGGTNAMLTFPNVSLTNAGSYNVVVANSAGSAASSVVTLSVLNPAVITMQPTSQTVAPGSNATFSVAASGTGPLLYQWYIGATTLAGATNATLALSNVSAANAGIYFVTVQNAASEAWSANVALTVTNPFALVAGAYNGLFYQTNDSQPNITVETAGMLANCVVATNGVYSAKIYLGGYNYPLTGTFNASGNDTEVVSRASSGYASLTVTVNLDMTGVTQMITGTVSNMNPANVWTAPLVADLATNAPTVPAGNFNLVILPEPGATNSPQTNSKISVLNTNGVITLAGVLADGLPVSQTVPVSASGTIPLYFSLYSGVGLLEGWINLVGGVPSGTLTWIRPPGVTTAVSFPQGFTNVVTVN